MSHLQQIEAELRDHIAQNDEEALVAWVKERVLESFRNGQGKGRNTNATANTARPRATASARTTQN